MINLNLTYRPNAQIPTSISKLTGFIYLRFFLKAHILPELFFMPRGLITILLFYSIPKIYQLSKFNLGILFFVVLTTSIIMTLGSITYGKAAIQTVGDEVPLTDQNEL